MLAHLYHTLIYPNLFTPLSYPTFLFSYNFNLQMIEKFGLHERAITDEEWLEVLMLRCR